MDGNGRWAQLRRRPRIFGHIKGARIAKKIITYCSDRKIPYLTLYAFSSENWLRPQGEVSFLMLLLRRYLKKETENLVKKNIRFEVVGDLNKLPADILSAIEHTKKRTAHCTGLTAIFAISYGSRQEITEAAKKIAQRVLDGELKVDEIEESTLHNELYTSQIPDPDLIIRTSGEQRISNFLMWQAAYAELYFSKTLWPDYKTSDLEIALEWFAQRERRFGAIQLESDDNELPIN